MGRAVDCINVIQNRNELKTICECGDEPSGFCKVLGISWLAEKLLASVGGRCCMNKIAMRLTAGGEEVMSQHTAPGVTDGRSGWAKRTRGSDAFWVTLAEADRSEGSWCLSNVRDISQKYAGATNFLSAQTLVCHWLQCVKCASTQRYSDFILAITRTVRLG